MVKVGASLLAADFLNLGHELKRAEAAGADFLHIDVMDGHLVSDIAFGADNVKAIASATGLCVEAHLMIAHPERFAMRMVRAGAGIVTLQLEPCLDLYKTIADIKAAGAKAYVCIRPATPLCMLEELFHAVDGILLVTVPLGIGGQKIIPSMYDKIGRLCELRKEGGYAFEIGVDGGVTAGNAARITAPGVDFIVAGSAVFAAADMKETVAILKRREGF